MHLVTWDGDQIVGGEPLWFKTKVASGGIERTADGAGYCLVAHNKGKALLVMPGDQMGLDDANDVFVVAIREISVAA